MCVVGHIVARGFFWSPKDALPYALLGSLLKAESWRSNFVPAPKRRDLRES